MLKAFPALFGGCMIAAALLGAAFATHAAQPAKLTACSLIPDGDATQFAMGKYDRNEDSSTSCRIDVFEGGVFVRYAFLALQQLPRNASKEPDYAKNVVSQSSNDTKQEGGKPLKCVIASATHFACFDVAAPIGSFKPGQRLIKVIAGKGNNAITLTVFHNKQASLEAATALAEKIVKRLQ